MRMRGVGDWSGPGFGLDGAGPGVWVWRTVVVLRVVVVVGVVRRLQSGVAVVSPGAVVWEGSALMRRGG